MSKIQPKQKPKKRHVMRVGQGEGLKGVGLLNLEPETKHLPRKASIGCVTDYFQHLYLSLLFHQHVLTTS